MDISTLNTLLDQAPGIMDRMSYYTDNFNHVLHPRFEQLIDNHSLDLLESVTVQLDNAIIQRSEDYGPIGEIINGLSDAAVNLEAAGVGVAQLQATLQNVDTLLNDATPVYDQVPAFEEALTQIKYQRQAAEEQEEPNAELYNFYLKFDAELKRDGAMIEFLRDTLRIYIDGLKAVRTRIVLLMNALVEVPPPSKVEPVITLLEQAQAISNRAGVVIAAMEIAKTKLFDIGNMLLSQNGDLPGGDLGQVKSSLNNLIAAAPAESASHDDLINQLNAARASFRPEPSDSALEDAVSLAGERRQEAVAYHESAHLLKVSFAKLDAIMRRLDSMDASSAEKDFYSDFRGAVDAFHLLATYTETSYGKFALTAQQWWDIIKLFLNDQRNKVQTRNDNLPFALLPVRLETRFMTTKYVKDNVTYSSYTDVFRSDDDVARIKTVSRENALQGTSDAMLGDKLLGVPAPQKIADKHELWVRIYPDNIAIHNHEDELTQKEIDNAQIYWNENWKALGDANLELGAWRALCASHSPQRAAWIVSQTTPQNPPKPTINTPLPHPTPVLPNLSPQPASWSQQPHTRVLPERFVVRVYSNGIPREYVGQVVPNPLPIGFDPANGYVNYLNQYGSEINLPPDLRWLTDFQEAENVGMGIRIPLQGNEATDGFERLLVLGLKMDWDATQSAQELEGLFDNHHYSTGLALVPQGTATNNTEEKKSGFASMQPGFEESFAVELGSPLFTNAATHYGKQDGQRLAEALGVSASTFHHVANSNTYDIQESMTMSRAIWSTTLGFYVKNMLTTSLALNYVPPTKSFFTNYVLGRGLIPAFRVKNQPYGVLTSTVYSKWKYSPQMQFSYEAKLQSNILEKLRKYWLLNFTIPTKLKRVTKADTDPSGTMVNVLGLHPSSVEFHQRMSVGSILSSNMKAFIDAAVAANQIQNPPASIFSAGADQVLDQLFRGFPMQSFSYNGIPRIFSLAFAQSHRLLNGPVIDSLPLSEIRTVENLQNCSANYLQWLATSPITYIRSENFSNVKNAPNLPTAVPKALLYLLLRQAWQLEYLDAANCLLTNANIISIDSWHNHELLNMTEDHTPLGATAEQKQMLKGFVTTEVEYENELQIEDVMRNLSNNQDYINSGMTPQQYYLFLRDQSRAAVEQAAANRFEQRLNDYNVDQSKWGYLTGTFEQIAPMPLGDHIRDLLDSDNPCIADLKEVYDAILKLQTLPTARLERCLSETLDTCAYRLDSWWNGLVTKRLDEQRQQNPGGVYLGAYGILETVKPGGYPGIYVYNISTGTSWPSATARVGARKMLDMTPHGDYPVNDFGNFVIMPDASTQPASFVYLGDDPSTRLIEDPYSGKIVPAQRVNPENQGFILAPSLNHAVAAAVMRAGYSAHKKAGNVTDAMAVGLSSDRVRTALYYLEGIKNGQNLGALLGYRFERGLHERQSGVANLDSFIQSIREKYALVSGAVVATPAGPSGQSRHVTDGLKLLEAYAKTTAGQPGWWVGVQSPSPISNTVNNPASYTISGQAIVLEIERIKDDLDAIGDLLLSEAIYQVTRGNHTKAGNVLQALGYGGTVPEPEIINTPRHADTFTHRCAIRFSQPASTWSASTSLRAAAEPALNNWLASQLPGENDIRINYSYPGSAANLSADMQDLDLQPIDLINIFASTADTPTANSTELSKRVVKYARTTHNLADSIAITVSYRTRVSFLNDQRNIFELSPILQSLARIVANSRILGPDDFMTPAKLQTLAPPTGAFDSVPMYSRISTAVTTFGNLVTDLTAQSPLPNPAVTKRDKVFELPYTGNTPQNAGAANTALNALRASLINASYFGIPSAFPESLTANTLDIKTQLLNQADTTYKEMKKRQTEIAALWAQVPNTAPFTPALHKERVTKMTEVAKLLFGKSFRVFTGFTFHDLNEVQTAFSYGNLLNDAGPLPVESWMSGVARVRPRMREYHKQMVLGDAVRNSPSALVPFKYTTQRVMQFPVVDNPPGSDRWIGAKLPSGYDIPKDAISMVLESDATQFTASPVSGMVIDEWPEQIPINKVNAGVAINYDQPNSDAPQSILLAVTPEQKGYWLWDDLMETLNETIDMAKIRAVDPDIIHESAFSQVLPMLIAQVSGDGTNDTPSLDFARNMAVVPPGFNSPIVFTPPNNQ